MTLRTIVDAMRNDRILTVAGIVLVILFLPAHTHGPDELWAITRMAWWIPFLVYVNELHLAGKVQMTVYRAPKVWHPTSTWVNRWGVSWRTLGIVVPVMLLVFFFAMLVVFA